MCWSILMREHKMEQKGSKSTKSFLLVSMLSEISLLFKCPFLRTLMFGYSIILKEIEDGNSGPQAANVVKA